MSEINTGVIRTYHPNGQLKEKYFQNNGLKEGMYKAYHQNGHLFREIEKNIDILDKASDMDYFCPNYDSLEKYQKINVWAQLFAAMSYYESAFQPTARFVEPTRDIDPVTNGPIISEGLLQLGYSDKLYHGCNFNWVADQRYSETDSRRTILDPYNNLSCGVIIMTHQIQKYGSIVISHGAYWAVLKIGHRNIKLEEIKKIIKWNSYTVFQKVSKLSQKIY